MQMNRKSPLRIFTIALVAGLSWSCRNSDVSESKHVLGTDDRISVNPDSDPWKPVGRLDMVYPDGTETFCSGTLVGKDLVLTAAHCIFNGSGVLATSVDFSPVFEFGNQSFQGRMIAHRVGTKNYKSNWAKDWAVIKIDRNLGDTFGFVKVLGKDANKLSLPLTVDVAGFPSDVLGGDIMSAHLGCRLTSLLTNGSQAGALATDCDIEQGSSGSAVMQEINGVYHAVGVISHEYTDSAGNLGNGVAASAGIATAVSDLSR
jgi:protease YdgD